MDKNTNYLFCDFQFELWDEKMEAVVSHFVIPSKKHFGGSSPSSPGFVSLAPPYLWGDPCIC